MQATATRIEGSNPGASKLRSSCDGCGLAKVKCDRYQPQCTRCKTLSLKCVYGQSLKNGKPARKRLAPNCNIAPSEKRVRTSCTTHSEPQNVSRHAQNNASSLDTGLDLPSPGITTGTIENLSAPDFNPFLTLSDWPQFTDWPQLDPLITYPSTSLLETPVNAKSTSEPHHCPRESYEIFRDLICPNPSLHAPESNTVTVSAQLDQVLMFNRTAIDRLTRVLKCPCSKSGHRAMVHASIVSRILIWYHQAAACTGRAPPLFEASDSSSGSSMPQTESASLVKATGFYVEQMPISIGDFRIDDENMQTAFRLNLVLSELKRTAKLIDMFTPQGLGEFSSNGVAGLQSHLGTWLRSEYSSTVDFCRAKLKALEEDLEA